MKPSWNPPDSWQRITTIDAHTAGEPFRVIVDGLPEIQRETMLARRRYAQQHIDELRTALMWEPRGHADMYGGLLLPASSPEADLGVLFLHNEGFSTMCGHGIIALATVVLEAGLVPSSPPVTTLRIETPAGLVTARAHHTAEPEPGPGGRVEHVSFHNVPAFVVALDETVAVPGLGEVSYDLAFGGAFYAYVDAGSLGMRLVPEELRSLIEMGRAIKQAVQDSRSIEHPFEEDLGFLYGVIFVGPAAGEPDGASRHSRNVCVFADGEVDRSPTGTGVSGRLALHRARGEIEVGQEIEIESLIGTCFRGRVAAETRFGPYAAIVPEVTGSAFLTGRHEFLLDPRDPLRDGFLLR